MVVRGFRYKTVSPKQHFSVEHVEILKAGFFIQYYLTKVHTYVFPHGFCWFLLVLNI